MSDFSDDDLNDEKPTMTMPNFSHFGAHDLKDVTIDLLRVVDEDRIKKLLSEFKEKNISPAINQVIEFILEGDVDVKAWRTFAYLIRDLPLEEARRGYEILFERFPCCGDYAKQYLELEKRNNNHQMVLDTLRRLLPYCVNIDIWEFYCKYFEDTLMKGKIGKEFKEAFQEVEKVYQYAVDTVGFFIDSDSLWWDYREFLKKYLRDTSDRTQRNNPNARLRRFFQKAVVIPFHNCDSIWKEYTLFEEHSVETHDPAQKRSIASKQRSVVEDKHKLAEDVYKERSEVCQLITWNLLPMRVLTPEAIKQVDYWNRYIEFEASNPMHLSPERLYHFMHMSYLRWLSCCYFCPDVWISFAKFEAQFSWERAKAVLDKAVAAIPRSLLLRTAYCDFLEEHHHVDDARSLYEKTLREFQEPVLWVLYMQFERRQRGADAARSVFLKGRSALCHPSLYLAAADLERNANRDPKQGLAILRAGMTHFQRDVQYIVGFAEYLQKIGDAANAFALLQQSLERVDEAGKAVLWDKIILLQAQFALDGDINRVLDLEKQFRLQVPSNTNAGMLLDVGRYMLWGGELVSLEDRELLKRRFPDDPKKEEQPIKLFEMDQSLLSSGERRSGAGYDSHVPLWIIKFVSKLPPDGMKSARGDTVDNVMGRLLGWNIPKVEDILI